MRRAVLGAVVTAAAAATAVAAVVGTSAATPTRDRPLSYSVPRAGPAASGSQAGGPVYLSLGDSLSVGVQPNAQGQSLPTGQGYADQLYASLHRHRPGLRLVKLGCPGETTGTLIKGGICGYRGDAVYSLRAGTGSQLAAATAYLAAHPHQVSLVTVDIGANDLNPCLAMTDPAGIKSCVGQAIPVAEQNLSGILAGLRLAGYPGPIVGMTYYDPELADWLAGPAGRELAQQSVPLLEAYNGALTAVYKQYGARIADVFAAFGSTDSGTQASLPRFGPVPANVATICGWTWECAAPPVGPNEHPNQAGYKVIARTFQNAYLAGRPAAAG
jgi:lysophospholipase L1-like esterase